MLFLIQRMQLLTDVPSSIDAKFRATSHRSDNLTKRTWRSLWRWFRANSRDVSLSLWRRKIELVKSTSCGLVLSLLFLDDSAFLRDGREDEVPSATRIPSIFRSTDLALVDISVIQKAASMAPLEGFGNLSPSPHAMGEFPGQEN